MKIDNLKKAQDIAKRLVAHENMLEEVKWYNAQTGIIISIRNNLNNNALHLSREAGDMVLDILGQVLPEIIEELKQELDEICRKQLMHLSSEYLKDIELKPEGEQE